jgi:molybdopterin molybdotransferase
VVTTGDELAAAGAPLGPAQIHESNGVMLEALARLAGAAEVLRLHAADTEGSLREAIARASGADVVVLSGGVSMGRHDLVPKVLEATGWTRVFHKVAQKPGKPIFFGVDGARLVFGLPGTPLGSHVGFHRYVAAALRKRLGRDPMCPTHHGRLAADWTSSGSRTLFRLARAVRGAQGWVIDLLEWGGSSDLVGPARANCYLRLPPGTHRLQAGDSIPFELLDGA